MVFGMGMARKGGRGGGGGDCNGFIFCVLSSASGTFQTWVLGLFKNETKFEAVAELENCASERTEQLCFRGNWRTGL